MSTRRIHSLLAAFFSVFLFAIVAGIPRALADDASPTATGPAPVAVVGDAAPIPTATAAVPDPTAAVALGGAAVGVPGLASGFLGSAPAVPAPGSLPPEVALIGVLATLAVATLKRFAPEIPGPWLPWISTAFGLLIELGLSKAGITHGIGWVGGLAGGVAGVGIREHVDQLKKASGFPALTASLLLAFGLLGTALIGSGCQTYDHRRFSETGQPLEHTSLDGFLSKINVEKLRLKTTEKRGTNTYSRSLGLDSAEGRVDAEGVDAVGATIGRLLIEGLKASSGAGALIPSAAPAPRATPQLVQQPAPQPEVIYVTNYAVASPVPFVPVTALKPETAPAVKPATPAAPAAATPPPPAKPAPAAAPPATK